MKKDKLTFEKDEEKTSVRVSLTQKWALRTAKALRLKGLPFKTV